MTYKHIYLFGMGRVGSNIVAQWLSLCHEIRHMYIDRALRAYFSPKFVKASLVGKQNIASLTRFAKMCESRPSFCKRDDRIIVYLLRDPYNWWASVLQRWRKKGLTRGKRRIMCDKYIRPGFKQYARQALGDANYLPDGSMFISYNEWFSDGIYRLTLCEFLGLTDCKPPPSFVPQQNQGSSFDKSKFNYRARKMRVMERWREFENSNEYRYFFDSEIVEMSKQLFGPPPLDVL